MIELALNEHKIIQMKKGLFILSAGLLLLASCGRYEEGPGFTLRSKKARLAGDWKVTEITVNGSTTVDGDPTLPTGYELNFTFEKDGKFSVSSSDSDTPNTPDTGTWEFKDDSLVTKYSDGFREAFRIVRLTNKEFWFDFTFNYNGEKDVLQYKFESK
jgi:hypothetical protein